MAETLTPMMRQYQRLRASVPADTLLLFRLGDFYELFFEDAKAASGLLNLALTKRNAVPMCGMPYHAAPGYIAKLIKAGRRVAICDQTSDPQPGKIVDREITQIISAGTVSELDLLEPKRANYLAAVYADEGVFGFAYAELSTGEFRLAQLPTDAALEDQLSRVAPAELLISDQQADIFSRLKGALAHDGYAFLPEQAEFTLCEHFQVKSLDGFGCSGMRPAVAAAGAIVHYLKHQLRRKIDHLTALRCDVPAAQVTLDLATQANLELVASRGARDMSLLGALDRTVTPMGGRKLRGWILQPLRDLAEIEARQQMIEDLLGEAEVLVGLREELKAVRDIERAVGRLSQVSGNARDLVALRTSLEQIPALKRELQRLYERSNFGKDRTEGAPRCYSQELRGELQELPDLLATLRRALVEDAPFTLKDGGIFQDGYHADLDELRHASREGKTWITELQEREIAETGIKSLKVRFNSVFGYFI
ncbi:MAG: DNA mismatch repair protein MutS, partial [Chthoniobacterales bacterium]